LHKTNNHNTFSIKRTTLERVVLTLFLIVLTLLAGLVAFLVTKQISQFSLGTTNITVPAFLQNLTNPGPSTNPGLPPGSPPPEDPFEIPITTDLEPWDGAGRVTILILGLDYRDWEAGQKYSRSDTMILLTLDPLTKTAGILSIPRDMWVTIPGFDHAKINTAYYLGEAYKLPGGGPGLAIKTVEQFLGVPINYYAQIDFGAFVKFIDEIGGVKIDVPDKIKIDLLGDGQKTIKTLKPGVQVLPGELALAYARNRSTGGGDFDRARRQQQVILGIRDRVLSVNMLPTLITKAPQLYKELKAGINTNLSLQDAIKLALLAQEVPKENIQRAVIGKKQVLFARSPDNLSILIPLPDKIHLIRDQIFASSSGLSPETPGNERQRMQAENARLAIYASSQNSNLGDLTAEYLRQLGVNVYQVNDSSELPSKTKIIDHTGNPYLIKFLVDLMQISEENIHSDFNPSSTIDVEIHLGSDWSIDSSQP